MADQDIRIKVTTVAEGDGAKKTADELGKVNAAVREGTRVTREQVEAAVEADKINANYAKHRAAETEKAATSVKGQASKFKAVGNAIKNFLGGSADSAIASLQQLGPKIAAAGAVAMASVGAFKAIGAAIERFRAASIEAKKADLDILARNAAEAAEQGARSFAAMGRAIAAAADKREGLAAIAKEAADLADQLERQNIANNRAKELSGATDEIERAKINRKYDEQLAGLDSRARDRGVSDEAARIEREKQRLAEENDLLRKGIQDDRRNVGRLSQAAQIAGQEADEYEPGWFTKLNVMGRGQAKLDAYNSFIEQQGELTGKAQETLGGMREKAERIKANEQAMQILEERKKAVVPAMGQLNAAMDMGSVISSASAGSEIRRMEGARQAEERRNAQEAAAAASREAAAREAYDYGRGNLAAARGSVADAEGQYRTAPGVGSAKALQEAKAALKEQEAAFKDLAQALAQASRESSRQAKAAKADLSAD